VAAKQLFKDGLETIGVLRRQLAYELGEQLG